IHKAEVGARVVELGVGFLDKKSTEQSFTRIGYLQTEAVFARIHHAKSSLKPASPLPALTGLRLKINRRLHGHTRRWLELDLWSRTGGRQRLQIAAEELCFQANQMPRREFLTHYHHSTPAGPRQVPRAGIARQLRPKALVVSLAVLTQAPHFVRADIDHLAAAVRHGDQIGLLLVAISQTSTRVAI